MHDTNVGFEATKNPVTIGHRISRQAKAGVDI
jgi:hypothetical protein